MASRSRRLFAVVVLIQVVLTAALVSVVLDRRSRSAARTMGSRARLVLPPQAPRRLGSLEATMPGNQGEASAGYDAERFANRAYPNDDIPLEQIFGARSAFDAIRARGASGRRSGQWSLLGPNSAVYQSTFFRFSYVPSQYEASGRVTAMAISPTCTPGDCKLWVAAAGGGLWRTDDALAGNPRWAFLTGSIGINAVGSVQVDPSDPSGNTIWLGTGEPNASGDSAAGVGLYKSTDGGDTWSSALGASYFSGRAIGSIAVNPSQPQVIYVATTRAFRGIGATVGETATIPGAAPWGLWKSIDGGTTFTFVHNGTVSAATCYPVVTAACSPWGVRRVILDPVNSNIVYDTPFGRGVWRSTDSGATWTRIKIPYNPSDAFSLAEIAVTPLPNGKTRIYDGEGSTGASSVFSRLFRSDDATAAVPVFTALTSNNAADPGFGSFAYCDPQCFYDNVVYTPAGFPDVVYLGGAYRYGEPARVSNGRAVILSTDAGVSFTDMTKDATGDLYPNGLHPDQHGIVVSPNDPFQFFSGSDGGVMRSDGSFTDSSNQCDWRPLDATSLARCHQLLSRVPSHLTAINRGLTTLQFQSLAFDPTNAQHILGGTQDNGTFESSGSPALWKQTFWGDGGQSGFDVAINGFRFHTFFAATPEVNFENGAIHAWNWIADRIYNIEPQAFYIPIISDPNQSEWMWAGLAHVWRTKTHGRGLLSLQELHDRCNEFYGDFTIYCGDWEPLGAQGYNPPAAPPPGPFVPPPAPAAATRLTGTLYGSDRLGGVLAALRRAADTSTLWAATSTGRVFISRNADAEPFSSVTFNRLDALVTNDPGRAVSGIFVDPANPNHAWISYNGFNAFTPSQPGHVFDVLYDPLTNSATWTKLDGTTLGDLPITDVAYDSITGDLYASTDFGVSRLPAGSTIWTLAATGMPNVEVSSLSIATGARRLYAATHGLSAWVLALP